MAIQNFLFISSGTIRQKVSKQFKRSYCENQYKKVALNENSIRAKSFLYLKNNFLLAYKKCFQLDVVLDVLQLHLYCIFIGTDCTAKCWYNQSKFRKMVMIKAHQIMGNLVKCEKQTTTLLTIKSVLCKLYEIIFSQDNR